MRPTSVAAAVALLCAGCAVAPPVRHAAPTLLPDTSRDMKTAGYWISRHPSPDRPVATPAEIAAFNARLRARGAVNDPAALGPGYPGPRLRGTMEAAVAALSRARLRRADGRPAKASHMRRLARLCAIERIPDAVPVRHGLVTATADERILPSADPLTAVPGDLDFDELQNSTLDIGTPLAVLHVSADGAWFYVVEPLSEGWVAAGCVALCARDEMIAFALPSAPVVALRSKATVYADARMTRSIGYVRMGSVLPASDASASDALAVRIPLRTAAGDAAIADGFIPAGEARRGFLPATPRALVRQAFELLNEPYGWGGMHGEQDCSRFVHEVFSTAGIVLPRNSGPQAAAGRPLASFPPGAPAAEKAAALAARAVGGATLLGMSGHIMLYLGSDAGRHYAIHALWAYREPRPRGDRARVVARVAVTDLRLGAGSARGSLLDRLRSVSLVAP